MISILLLAVIVAAKLFPRSAFGRLFCHFLVEPLARALNELRPERTALWGVVFVSVIGAMVAVAAIKDGMAVARAVPELVNFLLLSDATIYFELVAAVWIINATLHWRASRDAVLVWTTRTRRWISRRMRFTRQHLRERRERRTSRRWLPTGDEDESGALFA